MEDEKYNVLVEGKLAVAIPDIELPFDCSTDKTRVHHLCLTWKKYGQLWIEYKEETEGATCYDVHWQVLDERFVPKDCYYLDSAEWYGGGLVDNQEWPIQGQNISERPFITGSGYGQGQFGPVIEPYWLSSHGVSIIVNNGVPLHVSVGPQSYHTKDGNDDDMALPDGKYLCLIANNKKEPYIMQIGQTVWLNYTICTSKSIQTAHGYAIKQLTNDKTPSLPELSILGQPVWSTGLHLNSGVSQHSILEHAQSLKSESYHLGPFVIGVGWESYSGDFDFDPVRFPNVTGMISNLTSMGLQVVLTVHPYISTHSVNFGHAIDQGFLVLDAGGKAPGLVHWWSGPHLSQFDQGYVGVLNLNNQSSHWLRGQLEHLKIKYDIHSLVFTGGDVGTLPFHGNFNENLLNPNMFTHRYGNVARHFKNDVQLGVAFKSQTDPVLVVLPTIDTSWKSLQSIIPMILQLGVSGYPLAVPPPIGGSAVNRVPEEELFLRWFALSIFLPIMHLSYPPHLISNNCVLYEHYAVAIHKSLIKPVLETYAKSHQLVVSPLIKPLWFIENSTVALSIKDQFIVGDHFLVAPVLMPGANSRNIYFPKGKWREHDSTTFHTGPTWVYDYPAPLNAEPPHFIKQDS